jgi:hypothetical protein
MQAVVVDQPYRFSPPYHGKLWPWLIQRLTRRRLRKDSLNAAVEILDQARRPLLIFPEGVISRHNDRLNSMMDGTSFIARSAAKKRAERNAAARVVVHPVALRYKFHGDLGRTLGPVLDEIEQRFCWRPKRELDLFDRIRRVGESLLCLKEMEYLGEPQQGALGQRIERLVDHLLMPLEQEWVKGKHDAAAVGPTTINRVKKLRTAILPDMVRNEVTEAERERRWRQLADMYLAQQLCCYPDDYIRSNPTPERMLETVERFEEDMTDVARIHGPMSVTVEVGESIEVSPVRERGASEDPLITGIESQLQRMLGIGGSSESEVRSAELQAT